MCQYMGLVNDIIGTGRSGIFLGATIVVAVVTYNWIRGSGLPIVGGTGTNGTADVFGGR